MTEPCWDCEREPTTRWPFERCPECGQKVPRRYHPVRWLRCSKKDLPGRYPKQFWYWWARAPNHDPGWKQQMVGRDRVQIGYYRREVHGQMKEFPIYGDPNSGEITYSGSFDLALKEVYGPSLLELTPKQSPFYAWMKAKE